MEKKLDEVNEINHSELKSFDNFTNTNPSFRSNIKLSNNAGGFSSYQSDYPFNMISKKGSILSSLSLLTDKYADKNILILKNIYKKPFNESFYVYFINDKQSKIVHKEKIYTNQTNFIDLPIEFLSNEMYLFTNEYLCIPLYISIKITIYHLSIHIHHMNIFYLRIDIQDFQFKKNLMKSLIKKIFEK